MMLLLVGIFLILVFLLRREYLSRTRRFRECGNKIPGPKHLPLIGNLLDFGFSTKSYFRYLKWVTKQYGPVSRTWFGPKLGILLADPSYVELLLGNSINLDKSSMYHFAEALGSQGLLLSTGELWKKQRKIIAPTFQGQLLMKFVHIYNSNLDLLVEKMSKHQNAPEFDIFPYINLFALDVICESAMGVKVNAQLQSDSDYVKGISCLEKSISKRALTPWLHPDVIYKLTSLGREQAKCEPIVLGMTKRVIQERQKLRAMESKMNTMGKSDHDDNKDTGSSRKKAFLDYLLDNNDKEVQLTNKQLQDEVNNVLFAGHETTTLSLSYICWLLAKHQDIQEKVVAELETIFGDSLRHCTARDLPQMKYLEQVIKESLRLYPPVAVFARMPSEDIKTDKYVFPAGSEIGVNVYMLHRHPDYFPDPEKFDPDRFLPENCVGRHPYCYIPFSAGPRICVGKKFAMHEMKTTMAMILRHFKILPPENPFLGLDLVIQVIMKPGNGVRIRLQPRRFMKEQ